MRVLDLFCGAGGAAMGLHRAWPDAEIVGIDIRPQPHYPFQFVRADIMCLSVNDFLRFQPNFIWASPPCQHYSAGRFWSRGMKEVKKHPDFIPALRSKLKFGLNVPFVIENVPGAPLHNPVVLCGSMFGLKTKKGYLKRHRLFEASFPIVPLKCKHNGRAVSVAGHGAGGVFGFRKANAAEGRELLGIDWMNRGELAEAIPPAYSEYIARQFSASLVSGEPATHKERE